MRPGRISGADDRPLGAPDDWNEAEHGHCGSLFVRRENVDGVAYMRSAWEVEPTEAALLFAGAHLTLGVGGHRHPVVQLGVDRLPADFTPVVLARQFVAASGYPMVKVEMLFPHGGGQRGSIVVPLDGTLADAISAAVTKIEALAREHGWID